LRVELTVFFSFFSPKDLIYSFIRHKSSDIKGSEATHLFINHLKPIPISNISFEGISPFEILAGIAHILLEEKNIIN
jgi:hypothetical protein